MPIKVLGKEVVVAFRGAGIKKLLLSYSRPERVE